MGDSWTCDPCPVCKAGNWICHGDADDCTEPCIDSIECWKCDHVWLLTDIEELAVKTDGGFGFIERGRNNPNAPYQLPKFRE